MYITNNTDVALIAEKHGVDRIFIDLEYIGKSDRQGGMDTVQSKHSIDDIKRIVKVIKKSEILVRINPIHDKTINYSSSKEEIDEVINSGAQVIMLPFFKSADEVKKFIEYVAGRVKTMLLFETPESVDHIDEILSINGIDEVFIGLNDMSLGYNKKFMFELLIDGTVEYLINKFKAKELPYGFGGLASLDGGMLPGKYILGEHYRLGSTCVILSRSFCNVNKINDIAKINSIFESGLLDIRNYEKKCLTLDLNENHNIVEKFIATIKENI